MGRIIKITSEYLTGLGRQFGDTASDVNGLVGKEASISTQNVGDPVLARACGEATHEIAQDIREVGRTADGIHVALNAAHEKYLDTDALNTWWNNLPIGPRGINLKVETFDDAIALYKSESALEHNHWGSRGESDLPQDPDLQLHHRKGLLDRPGHPEPHPQHGKEPTPQPTGRP